MRRMQTLGPCPTLLGAPQLERLPRIGVALPEVRGCTQSGPSRPTTTRSTPVPGKPQPFFRSLCPSDISSPIATSRSPQPTGPQQALVLTVQQNHSLQHPTGVLPGVSAQLSYCLRRSSGPAGEREEHMDMSGVPWWVRTSLVRGRFPPGRKHARVNNAAIINRTNPAQPSPSGPILLHTTVQHRRY